MESVRRKKVKQSKAKQQHKYRKIRSEIESKNMKQSKWFKCRICCWSYVERSGDVCVCEPMANSLWVNPKPHRKYLLTVTIKNNDNNHSTSAVCIVYSLVRLSVLTIYVSFHVIPYQSRTTTTNMYTQRHRAIAITASAKWWFLLDTVHLERANLISSIHESAE